MPKVSIAIPAYNASSFIEDALQSIFSQEFNDYEVLVVDDGSVDQTPSILKKYESKIRFFRKNNGGPASARNVAIKNSMGKYIAFLDADDLWKPQKLKLQVDYMDKDQSIGFSHTNAECFSIDNEGKKVKRRNLVCDVQGFVFKDLFWSNFIVNSSVLVRHECLERVGLLDESRELIGSEDYDLWLRLSRFYKLGCVSDILLEYRLHDQSLIGESYENAFPLHVEIYKKFYQTFPDTKEKIGMDYNEALGDLYLRYAYKNFMTNNFMKAFKKSLSSILFLPLKGLTASLLIATRQHGFSTWSRLISRFELWHKITSAKW